MGVLAVTALLIGGVPEGDATADMSTRALATGVPADVCVVARRIGGVELVLLLPLIGWARTFRAVGEGV